MRKNAKVENKVIKSSGNVFTDLGFDDTEAQLLALRTDLIAQLDQQIKAAKNNPAGGSEGVGRKPGPGV